jgi:hypothetical protein
VFDHLGEVADVDKAAALHGWGEGCGKADRWLLKLRTREGQRLGFSPRRVSGKDTNTC